MFDPKKMMNDTVNKVPKQATDIVTGSKAVLEQMN